ncbi:MAG: hypothetical protein AAF748_10750 [Pseudomonadota bacterium]
MLIGALALACAGLSGCGAIRSLTAPEASPPTLDVMVRGAGGTTALPACLETEDGAEIVLSLSDSDGLAQVEVTFSGTLSDADFVVSPAGDDVGISEAGVPGAERVVVRFAPVQAATSRVSSTVSLRTAPPHTGILRVAATDSLGASANAGPFRVAALGGC